LPEKVPHGLLTILSQKRAIYPKEMSNTENTMFCIVMAMSQRQLLKIKYDTDPNFRVIEPYMLGENAKKEAILRAYDLSKKDWRLFLLSKIMEIQVLESQFKGIRSGFSSGSDKAIKKIFRSLK
jgi:predicted DNA-binding transcriptional regulator YafY